MPAPSSTTKISSSAEWRCGGAPSSPGGSLPQLSPVSSDPAARASSLQLPPSWSPSTSSTLTTFAGRSPTSGTSGSPAATSRSHGMVAAADIDPRAADPGDARAREVADLGAAARPEREHVEPVVAGAKGMHLPHAMDDAVARADRERSLVLAGRCPSHRGRRRSPLRLSAGDTASTTSPGRPGSASARPSCPGGRAEVAPLAAEMAGLSAAALDLVPMRDHTNRLCPVQAPCVGARPPPSSRRAFRL